MRILVIDPFAGAAGDMLIGGLLAAGADRDAVRRAMASVVADPEIGFVDRAGIRAIRVRTHAGHTSRTLADVLARVAASDAPMAAIALAERVFRRLHGAEASIHGDDHVHFHEVGADDAIADVLGAATALLSLGVAGVAVMPVPLGPGTIAGAHGTYPLPAPATVALLAGAGVEVRLEPEADGELVTPTGAALLAECRTLSWRTLGPFRIATAGYGAGSRDPPAGRTCSGPSWSRRSLPHEDYVEVLETNVDDATGEVLAHTLARLMEEGARDAQAIPALMKKGRMGYLVRVVCRPGDGPVLARVLAAEPRDARCPLGTVRSPARRRADGRAGRGHDRVRDTDHRYEAGPARREGIYLQTRIRAGANVGSRDSASHCAWLSARWRRLPADIPRERRRMSTDRLSSGSEALDGLLGGGYEHRVITQLYGEAATGKSTLAVLATVQALRTGRAVVYLDSEGFSAERFRQVAGDEADALVEKLFLFEPLDLAEQGVMIANADAVLRNRPAALIVVDSATALYRQEDLDDNEAMRLLTRQMLHLLGLARRHDLPVLVTNQVYMDPGRNRVVGLGGSALEHISKAIVRLEKMDGRRRAVLAKHRSRPEGGRFEYEITQTGIREV